ncbi:MAG: alpha-galactosidase [Planctomycetota bacterium]
MARSPFIAARLRGPSGALAGVRSRARRVALVVPTALLVVPMSAFALAPSQAEAARAQDLREAVLGGIDVDWLATAQAFPAQVTRDAGRGWIELSNGLLRRSLDLTRGGATVALDDERDDTSHLRVPLEGSALRQGALQPAARVTIEGVDLDVGGEALPLVGSSVGAPRARLEWERVRHASPFATWPPRGVRVTLEYALGAASDAAQQRPFPGLRVLVHHELYDGVPVVAKCVEVVNDGPAPFTVDHVVTERLACVESESWVESRAGVAVPSPSRIEAHSEYALGGMEPANAQRFGVRWLPDPDHLTQVNYLRTTPCLLDVAPDGKMNQTVAPGASYCAPMAFVVVHDSEDATRRALTMARVHEVIAPWVTENPLMMHVRHSDDAAVKLAVDQAAEVGFEVVILTFGSGFNMEDTSPESLARWRGLADYAHSRGVQLGGYTLLSSRRVQPESDMCVDPETGRTDVQTHGCCPALASEWGQRYLATVRHFLAETGFDLIEQDGPYPGDRDATARPPLQRGAEDSRFVQWSLAADLYRWCRASGVYVNQPDWYFLVGASKTGMGYRETNWSLPRPLQVLHARQNVFDGTRLKRPSMGWMFVPLTEYHGGGAAATVEPLDEHHTHYAAMLAANLGAGVQACHRGPRLYDTERTRALLERWVGWYTLHRDVLEAPIVHSASRRADGRDVDWLLHADPRLAGDKAILCVYRPDAEDDSEALTRTLSIDLTYAGLAQRHRITAELASGDVREVNPDPRGRVRLAVTIPPGEPMTWVVFR